MFFKIAVLKSYRIFTGKQLRWSLFSIKVLQACNFIKIQLQQRCFPVNIAKILRTDFFIEQFGWLLLPFPTTFQNYYWVGPCSYFYYVYFNPSKRATLHKKWSLPLRISSVNVRIWSHLLKKSIGKTSFFVQCDLIHALKLITCYIRKTIEKSLRHVNKETQSLPLTYNRFQILF